MFSRDRPEFAGLREEDDRRANRLFSLFRATDRDLFRIEAADSTALVDGVEGRAVGEVGALVVVVVVVEGGILNKVLNGLLNTLFVLVLEEANGLK